MLVAFLGPQGTNTHAAGIAAFGPAATFLPCTTIPAVFEAVELGAAEHGIVPIENSTEGVVRETIDGLLGSPLLIERELEQEIRHELMGPRGLAPHQASLVISHPQALAQCRLWLDEHHPHLERRTSTSTAAAAAEVARRSDALAIASHLAASENALLVHASGIADREHNATRFVCLSRAEAPPTGQDRTSLVLRAKHERGALVRLLEILDKNGVNLTRIESRPLADRRWEYAFVIDVEGHRTDAALGAALLELTERGSVIRVLGSYPRAARLGS